MLETAETLFHKLEEKLVVLLSERDDLIQTNQRLTKENQELKSAQEMHSKKLLELVSLVESVSEAKTSSHTEHFSPSLAAIKPLMAQGQV